MGEKNTFYKVDCVEVLDGILFEKMVFRFDNKLHFITSWNKTELIGREILNLEDRNKVPNKDEKSFDISVLIENGLEALPPHNESVVTCQHCGTILQWGNKEIKHVYDACECVEGIFCDNCSSYDGVCIICNEDEEDFEDFWADIEEQKANGEDVNAIIEDKIKLSKEYFSAQNKKFNNVVYHYIKGYLCDYIDCTVSFDCATDINLNVAIKNKEDQKHVWMEFSYGNSMWKAKLTDYDGISQTVHCVCDSMEYLKIVIFSELLKALFSESIWTEGAEHWACDPNAENPQSIDFEDTIKVIKTQQKFYKELLAYKNK